LPYDAKELADYVREQSLVYEILAKDRTFRPYTRHNIPWSTTRTRDEVLNTIPPGRWFRVVGGGKSSIRLFVDADSPENIAGEQGMLAINGAVHPYPFANIRATVPENLPSGNLWIEVCHMDMDPPPALVVDDDPSGAIYVCSTDRNFTSADFPIIFETIDIPGLFGGILQGETDTLSGGGTVNLDLVRPDTANPAAGTPLAMSPVHPLSITGRDMMAMLYPGTMATPAPTVYTDTVLIVGPVAPRLQLASGSISSLKVDIKFYPLISGGP